MKDLYKKIKIWLKVKALVRKVGIQIFNSFYYEDEGAVWTLKNAKKLVIVKITRMFEKCQFYIQHSPITTLIDFNKDWAATNEFGVKYELNLAEEAINKEFELAIKINQHPAEELEILITKIADIKKELKK